MGVERFPYHIRCPSFLLANLEIVNDAHLHAGASGLVIPASKVLAILSFAGQAGVAAPGRGVQDGVLVDMGHLACCNAGYPSHWMWLPADVTHYCYACKEGKNPLKSTSLGSPSPIAHHVRRWALGSIFPEIWPSR